MQIKHNRIHLLLYLQAKAATLTIAQGFSLAYQSWQEVRKPARREKEEQSDNVVVTTAVVEKHPFDVEGGIIGDYCEDTTFNSKILLIVGVANNKVEDLLIDWTKKDESRKPWDKIKEFEDSEPKASSWIQFDASDMNTQFER